VHAGLLDQGITQCQLSSSLVEYFIIFMSLASNSTIRIRILQ